MSCDCVVWGMFGAEVSRAAEVSDNRGVTLARSWMLALAHLVAPKTWPVSESSCIERLPLVNALSRTDRPTVSFYTRWLAAYSDQRRLGVIFVCPCGALELAWKILEILTASPPAFGERHLSSSKSVALGFVHSNLSEDTGAQS